MKDNIVFGCEYDDELYKKVLRTCALEDDLKILPGGDQCEIGERGITLSGGQKQRISMARAVYHGSDILFLDDPLSALDMNVGNYVLNECILGHLHDKTRILVTNNFHFLDCADRIAVMDAGRIAFVGTYAELKVSGIDLSKFIVKKKKKNNNKRNSDSDSDSDNDSEEDGCSSKAKGRKEKEGRNSDERKDPQSEAEAAAAGALTKKETRSKGLISFGLYVKYLKLGGMCFFVLIVIAYLNRLASRTLYSLALSSWSTSGSSNNSNTTATTDSSFSFSSTNTDYDDNGHAESMKYIWLQTGLLAYEMAMTFITFLLWCLDGRRASEKVHGMLIRALCGAPTRFFDTTPLGRLISRFSKDMNSVDQQLPNMIEVFMGTFVDLLVALIVICIANWWLACFIVAFAAVYLLLQRRYRRAAIELRRLEGTTRSPIYVHFDNTIAGLGCIRAYGCRDRFVADFATRMNANGRMQFSFFLFNRWFIQRLEWIGGAIQGLIVLSFTAAHYISTLDPGLVALALAKMSSITQALRGFSMSSTDVEQVMQAVERIMEFTDLPKEEKEDDDHFDGSADDGSVPPDWPATGSVTFKNFSLRYRDELPLVVKDLSCSVAGGEKIGVAGRTGSGKSTLLCSLFRIVEPAAGHIEIDGVDTRTLRLSTLRSKLSIIPQDPTLFSGSLRYNLDPFGEHTDDEIWNALDLAHLKSHVMGMENGLDSTVLESKNHITLYNNRTSHFFSCFVLFCCADGENFSVGQRQLICMARAVLRKSRIIAMDEATASVDIKTDMQIQSMIRTEFSKGTVFTVAHRLHTIMDSDKVMVFDEGRLVEFDTPENLLTNYPDGHFLSMVKAANDETLWKLARKEITLEECLASGCATTSTEDDNNETD